MYGSMNPFPQRFGGSEGTALEIILDALNQAQGTGVTQDQDSVAYARNLAVARELVACWSLNQRMTNNFNPASMKEFLNRWETILGIYHAIGDSYAVRRGRIAAKIGLTGEYPTHQAINDFLAANFSIYVGLDVFHSSQEAGAAFVPGGVTIPGGVTLPDGQWTSPIHKLIVYVRGEGTDVPDGYGHDGPGSSLSADFAFQYNQISAFLDGFLPAWMNYQVCFSSNIFRLDRPDLDLSTLYA